MKIQARTKILLAAILSLLLIPLLANIASGDDLIPSSELTAGLDYAGPSLQFGHSVAVSDDTMVIGAIAEHAAYVFEQENGEWKQVARLTNGPGFTYFGWCVAISGDTIVISAPYDSSFSLFAGAAYVFKRENGVWDENAKTRLRAGDSSSFFGWSLAFDGSTLAVGTAMSNSVYIYRPEGAKWPEEEARLTASDTGTFDRFGWSVAVSGDRIVVGAPWDDLVIQDPDNPDGTISLSSAGSAYVFDFDGNTWLEKMPKLTAGDPAASDLFGSSVAIDNDTVVVGACKDYSSVPSPGAAYVFSFDGEWWLQEAILTAREPADYDQFGYSVAIKDSTLLVGAPFPPPEEYPDPNKPGAAYVFVTDGSTWSPKDNLTASKPGDPSKIDQFGFSVAINGTTPAVGAPFADAKIQDVEIEKAGAAYVFVNNEPPVAIATWEAKEGAIEGREVTLDGSDSYDPDGEQLTYQWVQTGGPDVGLDLLLAKHDPTDPKRNFVAPELSEGCAELSFQLTVIDNKGLSSEPADVVITVSPNNRIHATLEGKHRHWLYWHKYSFYGHENDQVTIKLEADLNGYHRGSKATLILKDNIKHTRLFQTNRGSLPNEISATLPADGKYTIYVLKQPWFWSWWRHQRFEGDYILSLEGTCGKLVNGSR